MKNISIRMFGLWLEEMKQNIIELMACYGFIDIVSHIAKIKSFVKA